MITAKIIIEKIVHKGYPGLIPIAIGRETGLTFAETGFCS